MTARPRGWKTLWQNGVYTLRLVLRPLREADCRAWRDGYASRFQAQRRYDSGPVPAEALTPTRFERLIARHQALAQRDRAYVWAAFQAASGAHVGMFDLSTILRPDHAWANVGYFIHNTHQGRGLGAEGLRAVLDFGLSTLNYHRIEAAIRSDNVPATALARSAGMVEEGIRQSFWLDPDGWADHVIYVVIAP